MTDCALNVVRCGTGSGPPVLLAPGPVSAHLATFLAQVGAEQEG